MHLSFQRIKLVNLIIKIDYQLLKLLTIVSKCNNARRALLL